MLKNTSIATLSNPEFINLQPCDINPLMSKCEIKVLYIGENRNGSYITKEVATNMAATLRGAPIVGYFKTDKNDFSGHGDEVYITDDGKIEFKTMTRPYGFVSPDAKVWFQEFTDVDEYGIKITRTYLMCEGFLWTGQYKECQSVLTEGKPQSMELDEESLDGTWTMNNKTGIEFFIINDATFTKLCILGDDVEPCFEGASVKAPEVSTSFSFVDKEFKNSLYNMMQELKFALLQGGQNMGEDIKNGAVTPEVGEAPAPAADTFTNNESVPETPAPEAPEAPADSFEKKPEEEDKKDDTKSDPEDSEQDKEKKKKDEEDDEEFKKKKACQSSLIEQEYSDLKQKYETLNAQYNELLSFKQKIEDKEKDELISKFFMLSDEDKKDVVENKAKYSLEEIESKLSVICFRKKVNFDLGETSENDNKTETQNITTYSLNDDSSSTPAWIKRVKDTKASNNY